MSLNRSEKQAVIDEVTGLAAEAQTLVMAEYRGITVADMTKLRSAARSNGVELSVLKNTLARRAVAGSAFEVVGDQMTGPLIYGFSEDAVAAAKVVADFAKTNDKLVIRGGAFGGKVLDVNGVTDYSASLLNNPSRLVIDLYSNSLQANPQPVQTANASGGEKNSVVIENPPPAAERVSPKAQPAAVTAAVTGTVANASAPRTGAVSTTNAGRDKGEDPLVIPQPKSRLGSAKSGKRADLMQPASAPQPTRNGQSTLTRALGLKIGRIVIDAGHGGHDTGTIGPTGLMEKDLCLDVALRLGKIIQQRLPSADVVFTRSDDTFIPLEERTHIANEAKADMFISIHANSSQDSGARGIETYYLNLKGSDEAMEVAARENATSGEGIHELQDLVKQIARTEKIDESKEFAEDVQDSLSKRVQRAARTVKNRGVRKAPFVVLIGADMPSILTEISFLSNAADEKMLKQPEHRQRVAEGIYQGVASYLQNLNSIGVNQTNGPAPRRTDTSASIESSRNRN